MKRRLAALALCVLAALCVTTALAEEESRSYRFALTANGEAVYNAAPGDIVTVTFALHRTDTAEDSPMYAMQDEIAYDKDAFQLVEGSILASEDIRATQVAGADGLDRVYMNFYSPAGGQVWPAQRVVGSFQLRVTADSGTYAIVSENYLVSTADGRDTYHAEAYDVRVMVSEDGPVDAPDRPPVGMWLSVAAVAALFLLYERKKLGK